MTVRALKLGQSGPRGAVTMQPAGLAERGESLAGFNDRRHVRLSQPLLGDEWRFGPTGRSPSAFGAWEMFIDFWREYQFALILCNIVVREAVAFCTARATVF